MILKEIQVMCVLIVCSLTCCIMIEVGLEYNDRLTNTCSTQPFQDAVMMTLDNIYLRTQLSLEP